MQTYEEVAKHHKLDEDTTRRFLTYMRGRSWRSEEALQCHVGYAGEWAERFKAGIEFAASDWEGKQVLISLNLVRTK